MLTKNYISFQERHVGTARKSDPSLSSDATVSDQAIIRWRWGVIAAILLMLLSLYPQFHLYFKRGYSYQGSCVFVAGDESVYAAYLNALIEGRARRADPLTGRDTGRETIFSIQFVPAYLMAVPARAVGATASEMFIVLLLIATFLSTLAIFYLIFSITGENAIAAVGAICVLCLGTLASGNGMAAMLLGSKWIHFNFPFLRRYQPAGSFPFFFFFCALVWRALTGKRTRLSAIYPGIVFAILVFSYFYLWTAALAWLASLLMVWLLARPLEWRETIERLVPTALMACLALAIYGFMLSRRAPMMERMTLLEKSHTPDFLHVPELIGALVLIALMIGVRKGFVREREPSTLFTASFALLPAIVFNQQVVTGLTLQPFHYGVFIANYVALIGVVLVITVLRPNRSLNRIYRYTLLFGVFAALLWGAFEWSVMRGAVATNIYRDQMAAVGKKLMELSKESKSSPERELVFSASEYVEDNIPTFAPQAVLWSPHMFNSDISLDEKRERYFQQLYYSNVSADELAESLAKGYVLRINGLFGLERGLPYLTSHFSPISPKEIQEQVSIYRNYAETFNRDRAARFAFEYVVSERGGENKLSNIDRWYERDAGEPISPFTLYRVKLREQ